MLFVSQRDRDYKAPGLGGRRPSSGHAPAAFGILRGHMDLHLIPGANPTPEERAAVDAALGPPSSGWEGGERRSGPEAQVARSGQADADERRHLLLPALHAIQ